MNVYDKTHELAKELKECPEYRQYKVIKEKVYADQDLKEKVKKFDQLRYEMQLLTIQGEKQNETKMQELQKMYEELMQNNDVKEYFDKEIRFNVMLADVNKIIGDAVKDVLN
mgnify:FL=1